MQKFKSIDEDVNSSSRNINIPHNNTSRTSLENIDKSSNRLKITDLKDQPHKSSRTINVKKKKSKIRKSKNNTCVLFLSDFRDFSY